jgi:hypothetical protein
LHLGFPTKPLTTTWTGNLNLSFPSWNTQAILAAWTGKKFILSGLFPAGFVISMPRTQIVQRPGQPIVFFSTLSHISRKYTKCRVSKQSQSQQICRTIEPTTEKPRNIFYHNGSDKGNDAKTVKSIPPCHKRIQSVEQAKTPPVRPSGFIKSNKKQEILMISISCSLP